MLDSQIEARRRRLRHILLLTRIAGVFMILLSVFAAGASMADLVGLTHNGSPKVAVLVWLGAAGLSAFLWDLFASRARGRLSALITGPVDARPAVAPDRA